MEIKCTRCGKQVDSELIEVCYQCAIKGKDLTPKKYLTNLSFVPKPKKDSDLSTVEQGQ